MTRPTTCRWCGHRFTQWTVVQWRRLGFCSKQCCMERYDEDGRE